MDFAPLIKNTKPGGWLKSALAREWRGNGRLPLTKVYLEPTTRCNLHCRSCMRQSWKEKPGDMTPETFGLFLKHLEPFSSLKTVAFWGFGEPLLHPDIGEMIRQVARRGIHTEMITNGMLLSQSVADDLIDARLGMLVVSLDGTNEQSQAFLRRGADLQTILNHVEYLRAASASRSSPVEIGIEFVLSKSNIDELAALRPLARRIGASFVIVSNLLPYAEEMKDEILYWMATQTYSPPRLIKGAPQLLFPAVDPWGEGWEKVRRAFPELGPGDGASLFQGQFRGYCPFIERGSVSITKDGGVAPCIALMHDYRCYVIGRFKDVKAHVIGTLGSRTLASIWNDQGFQTFRKRVADFDFSPCASCGGCEYAESNQQDCIGSPFPTCGGCLWAKGLLLCP